MATKLGSGLSSSDQDESATCEGQHAGWFWNSGDLVLHLSTPCSTCDGVDVKWIAWIANALCGTRFDAQVRIVECACARAVTDTANS